MTWPGECSAGQPRRSNWTYSPRTGKEDRFTMMSAVPPCCSLVAVIVVEPSATPVTRPLAETLATAVSPVDQVNARPGSVVPEALLATAVNCIEPPGATVAVPGDTVTDPTGSSAGPSLSVPQRAKPLIRMHTAIHATHLGVSRALLLASGHAVWTDVEVLIGRFSTSPQNRGHVSGRSGHAGRGPRRWRRPNGCALTAAGLKKKGQFQYATRAASFKRLLGTHLTRTSTTVEPVLRSQADAGMSCHQWVSVP